ncbi:hypothetical protein BU24DRAFT_208118 [Aaosphaeria arxii CBS 175.79]|uniref:Uncharacterized protein n=1 Tax=Aaosphaeria arxii CBS 175.79 TaxID=1450172 RepID=A0A6A5XTM7_9PLEO|nr:uncharacterized protein BU24DRAFT_208118 [Aaosphaeria arxii CBS 175.79]KAF2016705.1 hypothetical protein BU24DRAFT_208118 [Aaosphaeria arxii CBS 175.79]
MQPWVVILIVLLAAGGVVCCGFAVCSLYGDNDENKIKSISQEQAKYMAAVRSRTVKMLAFECR